MNRDWYYCPDDDFEEDEDTPPNDPINDAIPSAVD